MIATRGTLTGRLAVVKSASAIMEGELWLLKSRQVVNGQTASCKRWYSIYSSISKVLLSEGQGLDDGYHPNSNPQPQALPWSLTEDRGRGCCYFGSTRQQHPILQLPLCVYLSIYAVLSTKQYSKHYLMVTISFSELPFVAGRQQKKPTATHPLSIRVPNLLSADLPQCTP